MIHRRILFIFFLISALCGGSVAQTDRRRGPVIRQVDHILVESEDPATLFSFFADTLQLPVAWPITRNAGFTSGGVGFGNVTLELFQYANPEKASESKAPKARYAGIAFEPYPLEDALAELKIRGIPFNSPEPHVSTLPDGTTGTQSTTVVLPSLSQPGLSIFLYEYSPAFLKVQVRRQQLGNRLALNKGGPLGILAADEIVIALRDMQGHSVEWEGLLGNPAQPGKWKAGEGPAIRLIEHAGYGIRKIVLQVEVLDRTRSALEERHMRGSLSDEEVCLNASRVQGLNICFVE